MATTKSRVKTPQGKPPTWKSLAKIIGGIILLFVISLQYKSCMREEGVSSGKRGSFTEITRKSYEKNLELIPTRWAEYHIISGWGKAHFEVPKKDIYIRRKKKYEGWSKPRLMRAGSTIFPFEMSSNVTALSFRTRHGNTNLRIWQYNF